eukprot:CAMPEP_0195008764 /NCGR_PEP_ID=MMETSP0326_2-20130528/8719_1 /TAXON_ID=2866 ORGANISM="Crypthecodinium cohnii, Strain Seligo" /NCGR_SAMPLE_ID=MMETSP0326_2 /ASSEMBLY_ACC=CAM_ASM_000348 /LENGTH=100 /DNA_ID=CAMNT_0040016679 /DNA_START=165 /DNA_END=470 /DNA_ORIENTATION=-
MGVEEAGVAPPGASTVDDAWQGGGDAEAPRGGAVEVAAWGDGPHAAGTSVGRNSAFAIGITYVLQGWRFADEDLEVLRPETTSAEPRFAIEALVDKDAAE